MKLELVGSLVGIAGFVILGMTVGWLAALGVFIMLWGNNIERGVSLNKKIRALYKLTFSKIKDECVK